MTMLFTSKACFIPIPFSKGLFINQIFKMGFISHVLHFAISLHGKILPQPNQNRLFDL